MMHFVVFGEPFDFAEQARRRFELVTVTLIVEVSRVERTSGLDTVDAVIEVEGADQDLDALIEAVGQQGAVPTQIVALVDHLALLAARFAERLGLTFHSVRTIADIVDKASMRQRLAGVPELAVRAAVAHGDSSLRTAAATIGFPLVVKPADSTGSQGVSVLHSEQGLVEAGKRARAVSETVLVEEFLEGPQYSVEAFSEEGKHVVLAVTRKYSDPLSLVELGHVLPADLSEEMQAKFANRTVRLLVELGLEYGPSHTEFVLTDRGPVPLETHARVGGDEIYCMVDDAVGVDMEALQIEQLFGEKVLDRLVPAPRAAQAIWFGAAEAVTAFCRPEVTESLGAAAVCWLRSDDAPAPALRSSADRVFHVRAEATTASDAIEIARLEVERLAHAAGLSTRLAQLANVV